MSNHFFERRGQVAETTTWIFATVAVVIIVLVSVFVSSFLGSKNGINQKAIIADKSSDVFAENSLTSFLLTKGDSGNSIYKELQANGAFSNSNGNLAKSILTSLYGTYYKDGVYVGIVDLSNKINFESNDYFGRSPVLTRKYQPGNVVALNGVNSYVYLEGTKFVHMILAGSYSR